MQDKNLQLEDKILYSKALKRFPAEQLDIFKPALPAIKELAEKMSESDKEHSFALNAVIAYIEEDLAEMSKLVESYPQLKAWPNALELKLKGN